MRLSKNETSAKLPFPMPANPGDSANLLSEALSFAAESTGPDQLSLQQLADLMDLVANYRSDLMPILDRVLRDSPSTRELHGNLADLIEACDVAGTVSPCATAMAIAEDLERLVCASDAWTHPAQVIQRANSPALFRLCKWRLESDSGSDRERLEQVLPRLERAARLAEKAAVRRVQEAARQTKPRARDTGI